MKQTFYDAEITHIIDESPAVKRFFFRVPHLKRFEFKPGQFVMLNLPIDSKISYRSYSIASAPGNDNEFELIIVLNPPGQGTPFMWENYKVGSIVPVVGPLGKFTLPEKIEHDLCFIATGTGIAPLRSMLHHIINTSIPHKDIYFIFGNRYVSDIYTKPKWKHLRKNIRSFASSLFYRARNHITGEAALGMCIRFTKSCLPTGDLHIFICVVGVPCCVKRVKD